ncbi:hypothetical protein D3C76_1222430 [compost metagenome]
MGIDAEPDRAFGEARLEDAEKTLAPFNVVVCLLQAVAVHVVVACVECEAGVFGETLGSIGSVSICGHRCSDCNEQRRGTEWETHGG